MDNIVKKYFNIDGEETKFDEDNVKILDLI